MSTPAEIAFRAASRPSAAKPCGKCFKGDCCERRQALGGDVSDVQHIDVKFAGIEEHRVPVGLQVGITLGFGDELAQFG